MQFDEFRRKLFEMAEKEGFSEFEIYYSDGESFKVTVYEREIDNYSVNTRSGLGFRGIYNGRMGYSYTEILDDDAVMLLVKKAKGNALLIENDDREVIYDGKDNYVQMEGFTPELAAVGADEKIKLALELEKLTLEQDERVKRVKYCGVQSFDDKVNITNSKGLDLSYRINGVYAILMPVISDGDKMNTSVSYKVTNKFSEINAEQLAKEAVQDALAYIGARTVPSGKYRIALKNEAAVDLLETFSGIFSAERVQKGLSLLKEKVGTVIGSKKLTIIDDPLLKDGMCSAPFDAEGVATYTKEVVSEGELKTYLYNLKAALKDGVKSTGNAAKASYASPVDISPSNFYIKPGEKSFEDILKELGDGLYITELQGLHSGANSVSGDFSLAAKGFSVRAGIIESPVEQITVAGNFINFLMDVEEAGSDLKFGMPSDGCFGSPTLLVRELSVGGS